MKGLFVTGTDTGVGKTLVSCALLHALAGRGLRSVGMKPIASGCERTPEGLRNEDALALQAHATLALDYPTVNPYAFEPAIAPHLAAAEAGVAIDLQRIARGYGELASRADCVVVEGAGGWRVPLDARSSFASIARQLELPVVLVVGVRLGCLNHALLSAEAIARDGCRLAGWVANIIDPDDPRAGDQVDTLRARIEAPLLGVVPYLPKPSAPEAAAHLELGPLWAL